MKTKQEIIDYIKNNEDVRNRFIEFVVNRIRIGYDGYACTVSLFDVEDDGKCYHNECAWVIDLLFSDQKKQLRKK